jgi:hypothetical protein
VLREVRRRPEAGVADPHEEVRSPPHGPRQPPVEVVREGAVASDRERTAQRSFQLRADDPVRSDDGDVPAVGGVDGARRVGRVGRDRRGHLSNGARRLGPALELVGEVEPRIGRRGQEMRERRREHPGMGGRDERARGGAGPGDASG